MTQVKRMSKQLLQMCESWGWKKIKQWSMMIVKWILIYESQVKQRKTYVHDEVKSNQENTDIQIGGITCKVNKVERLRFDNLANLTGPDPKKLGASPTTQFLTANGPQERIYILDMLPDTGAGVTLISEKVARERKMVVNRNEAHMYEIRDALEQSMSVVGTCLLYTSPSPRD